ncbi:hypothetical protein [Paenibacillus glycinis]|uniref:DUF4375 domain-containing protein n=1 Tax=Paenibacillus glycinis TaxID=2697035 RepID=A0ABW9XN88_9BACL|nr:hypothetical protein [Paenibacillus glycinis]NBD24080.1 hypothetical protein [Paenibacillus glycinis]
MSEFSESYHLIGRSEQEGIDLLKRAGQGGLVFPAANDWVTMLPDHPIYTPNADLIRHNAGVLLHYVFAEDHGWSFALYERDTLVSSYECDWNEEDIVNRDGETNLPALLEVLNRKLEREQAIKEAEIARLLAPADFEEVSELEPAYSFAELLGLSNYAWLSFHYAERDYADQADYIAGSGVIKVD